MGYEESNADVRVAQYESGYRVPINNTLYGNDKDTEHQLYPLYWRPPGCTEEIMLTFLLLDEDDRSTIHLFQLVRNPGKCNASDDKSVCYYDNDDWPAHALVGMWLKYGLVNDFMRKWCLRKEQLRSGEISENEYFDWKINWSATNSKVDYNGKDDKKWSYQWRKK